MVNPRYLVISLGNPLPKYTSLHSAGHFTLRGLAPLLPNQPPFAQNKFGKANALVSQGSKYTLVQSPTLMNVSGPFVARAWAEMLKTYEAKDCCLVILHDELEKPLGVVRLVDWERSHKGHNGLKSIRGVISQARFPESPLVRMAVGIGRPKERDPETVARYVLDTIPREMVDAFEGDAAGKARERLRELEAEWCEEAAKVK
ncbi:peptidyl-tRNA hydrolase-like protein [Emericellopsis cladophorae]|uniref:peptidyl-tRNA hydrolase n=1 Tax=Emericellopsis cladophorae TaxID=2686198 RepID=A0A9Q0BD92_9HYPO|nr:peptidyl-tRNA hydrolase-like protein [Emericellopsis cladophorae]KAI6781147.1 peptidyl-tRNA hydrolase-like protein [Emericellopsis cladophorae]